MMKCIFHIGPGKTGTSAIQTYLLGSREGLREAGYLYPETGLWGKRSHNGLFLSKQRRRRLTQEHVATEVAKLKEEIEASRPEAVILSAEVVAYSVHSPEERRPIEMLFDALDAEVHIICFARRQDALFDSRFKQHVQGGFERSPWNFVRRRYEDMFFDKLVEGWMELPRVKQVSCIAYDGANPTAGVDDFWRVAGLPAHSRNAEAPQVVNPSLDGQRLQMKYFFNQFDLESRVNRRLMRSLRSSEVPDRPRTTLFNDEARDALLAIFEKSNDNLERKFQCRMKVEESAERQVFEPIGEAELKDGIDSLFLQDEDLISRIASNVLGSPAPRGSDLLAEKLAARLAGTQKAFRPDQLAQKLKELVEIAT
jgi:hypothetical protein